MPRLSRGDGEERRLAGTGWFVDPVATALLGSIAHVVVYVAIGLTPTERRGAAALPARPSVPGRRVDAPVGPKDR